MTDNFKRRNSRSFQEYSNPLDDEKDANDNFDYLCIDESKYFKSSKINKMKGVKG
jgi:hypothetical protein